MKFYFILDLIKNTIEVKCGKCSKEYTNQFEVARHHWRSHEEINCNLCGKNLNSRHALKIHKEKDHNMKMNQEYGVNRNSN